MGRRLAEGLGFAYYDQEIIVEIAQRTKLAEDYVQQIIESRPSFSFPIHIGVTFVPIIFCAIIIPFVFLFMLVWSEKWNAVV